MKIATWNVNSVKMRFQHLRDFLTETNPDIVSLQEIKCETEKFPYEELSDLPYNYYVHGQKSYHGVAILSKFRADEVINNFPNNPCPGESRFLEICAQTNMGFYRFISLYAPNGGAVGSHTFDMKLEFYSAFNDYLLLKKSFDEKLIIGGDFNIAPFDIDVYSPKDLENTTCFTLAERKQLRTILNSGFEDLYRMMHPDKQEFSWWDYRSRAFQHNRGMRIDLLLGSSNVVGSLHHCYIDHSVREKNNPSDHAPVVVY
jgi:exodeoxyribonuclease-3